MKDLTKKQQAIWELKEQGLTRPEIAAELGVGKQYVSKCVDECLGEGRLFTQPGAKSEAGF